MIIDLSLYRGRCGCQVGEDLVDTFRQKEKSDAEGGSAAEKAQNWAFYNRMSFMKPYVYKRR